LNYESNIIDNIGHHTFTHFVLLGFSEMYAFLKYYESFTKYSDLFIINTGSIVTT